MDVCCECCVLSGRGLCDGLITRPEESYRLWRVVCNQETSRMKLKPATGLWKYNHSVVTPRKQTNNLRERLRKSLYHWVVLIIQFGVFLNVISIVMAPWWWS